MAATIELKYFNSFWLKKIKTITDVVPGTTATVSAFSGLTFTLVDTYDETLLNVGQQVSITYTYLTEEINYTSYIVSRGGSGSTNTFTVAQAPINFTASSDDIVLGKIINFDNIPQAYQGNSANDWLIEEARIRGGYNNTSVDYGVKAYLVEDEPAQSNLFSGLIHSGIFNSRTGVNNTNQFSVGEDITRTIDPVNGSIQRLYAEDTNLIIFQENKVSKSLIDKDAIYSAEGNASVTSRNLVIGQNVAYAGEYGISKDPESFAVNGYRKYFTDRDQNVVCRLSMDGITVISNYGMTDYFRDNLSSVGSGRIVGGWDAHNKQYVLSMQPSSVSEGRVPAPIVPYSTLAFDENVKGWVSLFDYKPDHIFSLNNEYFTAKIGDLYRHYTLVPGSQNRGNFYGVQYNSDVTLVFNAGPSMIKNFQTINYEGTSGWVMDSFITNTDLALPISQDVFATTLAELENSLLINRFKLKEDKYYADLVNNTPSQNGEILWGSSSSGLKGFFGEVKMRIPNNNNGKKELFAVSTGFVQSS